jgi:ubiquinol-cytochrome c reductase cytochrome c1 subunit
MIKKLIAGCIAALCLVAGAQANTGGAPWDKFPAEKVTDVTALQNGAKLFVNYCLNCHSASYMRYNRMRDIGLTEAQIKANLMFATDKVGDTMKVAMDPKLAKDLTVIARSRAGSQGTGADYLYTYMRSFYRDETRPTGWNNTAFPLVAMPHVLWELQGQQKAVFEEVKDAHDEAKTEHHFKGFEIATPGKMTPAEYNEAVADLVAYLQWMGEPAQNQRVRLGVWVLIFLSLFIVLAWRLNASFWKDVK